MNNQLVRIDDSTVLDSNALEDLCRIHGHKKVGPRVQMTMYVHSWVKQRLEWLAKRKGLSVPQTLQMIILTCPDDQEG